MNANNQLVGDNVGDNVGEIVGLTCCCCAGITKGRQWYNRDLGYGLCGKCAEWIATRETVENMRSYYGIEGTHYFKEVISND